MRVDGDIWGWGEEGWGGVGGASELDRVRGCSVAAIE